LPEKSLYRRHRPQSFDAVVGQEHVVRTLRNAVERSRVHHAYMFVGSRGTGKTSVAKILARSLNCVEGPTLTPCGRCESCTTIAAGTSLDVIEMDAASNRSIDDIRDLRERVGYAPASGRWKIYILDEAHMLTREAWNAFLKTLEEPPPSTVFVLCTTEAHKVMPTIADRCQRFDFQRPSLEQIASVVRQVADAEGIEIDDGAVGAIARAATGSFRDALGTLDQLVSYGGDHIETSDVLAVLGVAEADVIRDAAAAIAAGDARAVLEVGERLAASGRDTVQFGRDLLAHLRQLLVTKTVGEAPASMVLTVADPETLEAQADAFSELALSRAIDAVSKALADVREGDEARMTIELALLRAARPQLDPSKQALAQRLEELERAMGAGDDAGDAGTSSDRGTAQHPDGYRAVPRSTEVPTPPASSDPSDDAAPPPAPADDDAEEAVEADPKGPVDLERLVAEWPAVVDQVRQSGAEVLSRALAAARPIAVDGDGAVKLGFPPSAGFNKRKAEAQDARDRFAEALKTIVGERLRPVYVLLDPEPDAPKATLSDDELIARVKDEFDATELGLDEAPVPEGGLDAGLDAGLGTAEGAG
jgi:DNA polymerase-3 subunit gamma/tau